MTTIVFFGTPDIAVPYLQTLIDAEDFSVVGVVTQPDKPVGRKKVMTPSPVKVLASEYAIPVLDLNDLEGKADLFVIFAYGKIIPQRILDQASLGSVNVHPSKLPLWRGPSPIQSTIAAQDDETAISIMLIDDKMDHGPLLGQLPLTLDAKETTPTLIEKIKQHGPAFLLEKLRGFIDGSITPQEQNHDEATFCRLLKRENGLVDWSETAEAIYAKFRAYKPWPGIHTVFSDVVKLIDVRVSDVADLAAGETRIEEDRLLIGTASTAIEVLTIQPASKPAMPVSSFLAGNREMVPQRVEASTQSDD